MVPYRTQHFTGWAHTQPKIHCVQLLHTRAVLTTKLVGLISCSCSRSWIPDQTHLSAPAQDNILLMRMTWKGCRRMRMWKPSLPHVFTMYLLAQIRAASRATQSEIQFNLSKATPQQKTYNPTTSPLTLRRQLLILVRHHVTTQGEFIYLSLLPAQVEDPDLGIWVQQRTSQIYRNLPQEPNL